MAAYDEDEEPNHQEDQTAQEDEETSASQYKKKVTLSFQLDGSEGAAVKVAVTYNTEFRKVFKVVEERWRKQPGTLKFLFEGQRVRPESTPKQHEMTDGDQIDAFLAQQGGT